MNKFKEINIYEQKEIEGGVLFYAINLGSTAVILGGFVGGAATYAGYSAAKYIAKF
ncbi:hypothetical protein [Flammeovirga pacifica]|uniref:hypothetical protein n=1 Tax=Flammeovirga pacifica TaxID=915059 RepID=UPI001300D800|nr:hypothetical protein [Flammeovirga pacifica]